MTPSPANALSRLATLGLLGVLGSSVLPGCSAPRNGTAVGNPGHLDVSVNVPPGVTAESAMLRVAAIELVSCAEQGRGRLTIVDVDTTFDGLAPSPVEIPGGEWCTTILLPDGEDAFVLEGTDADGESVLVGLTPDPFVFDGAYRIDGNQIVVALDLGTVDVTADNVESTGPFGEEGLMASPLSSSGVFLDDDADGRVGDAEAQVAEQVAPEGCGGCSTSPGRASSAITLLIGLAGILGWRRRQRHPHRPG